MKLRSILLATFAFLLLASNQRGTDKIDPDHFDDQMMRQAVVKVVNEHRAKLGMRALIANDLVQKAAQDQVDYLNSSGKWSHEQANANKRTPKERIQFYGGTVRKFGENLADIYVVRKCSVYMEDGSMDTATLTTYRAAAEKLLNAWLQSSGHRKNIETPEFTRTGIGVYFEPKSKKLVVAQVFAD